MLFAGRYHKNLSELRDQGIKKDKSSGISIQPFLMLFDRIKNDMTIVKAFKSRGLITALSYGPYDNGHVLVGTSTGDFLAFNSLTLQKLCCVKVA